MRFKSVAAIGGQHIDILILEVCGPIFQVFALNRVFNKYLFSGY